MRADVTTLAAPPGGNMRSRFLDEMWRRTAVALFEKITRGSITWVDGFERFVFGRTSDEVSATIVIKNPAVYRAILFGGSVAAGKAYMKGWWTCDDLVSLTRILAQNIDMLDAMDGGKAQLSRRIAHVLSTVTRRNTRTGSRRNIEHHYDLSNDMFATFLDSSMVYSSAIFERDDYTLEQAQTAKLEAVCKRLGLVPGDHLLEIGTGWGALAIYAAREYGCRVTTTTISQEQYQLARESVHAAGLDERVRVLLRDYRDLDGTFDKLVSIEMIEAVGHEYLDDFFRACSERLAPHGRMLIQAITIADQHHERHRASVDFIKEYIFPGSCIPSVTSMVTSTTRATDLRLTHLEDMTQHYALTLRHWRERFMARSDRVRELGFDEEFIRMWEYYLAYCEGGFAERYLGAVHMVFTKPDARPTPTKRGAMQGSPFTRDAHAPSEGVKRLTTTIFG